MVFIGIILALLAGILIGLAIRDYNTVTLTDTYTQDPQHSEQRRNQYDAMKLQNEIANSGAIKRTECGHGKIKIALKVVK